MKENPVFSFKIPGPARVLLPILPTLVLVVSCTDKPQPLHNILMIDYIQQKLQYATLFRNTYSFGVTKRYDMLWFYYWHFIFFLKIALFIEQFTPKLIFYTLKMRSFVL